MENKKMIEYANPNEYTAKLDTVYSLEERIKHLKEVPEVVIHRIQTFHGWGGRTTDDVYYIASNGELRHNQTDVKMFSGAPISNSSRDTVVKRNPRTASIIGAVIGGALGVLAYTTGNNTQDTPLIAYSIVETLLISAGYLTPICMRTRPGDSEAWINYRTYRKGNKKQ